MIGKSNRPDHRVSSILDQLGLNYEVDGDGDFRLLFGLGDGRSQLVFVDSKTYRYQGLEVRSIWSPAYKSPTPFSGFHCRQGRGRLQAALPSWRTRRTM